jgi:hypothetical protein
MKLTLHDLCNHTKNNDPTFEWRAVQSKVTGLRSRKNFRRFIFLVKSKMVYSSKKGHIVTILFPNLTIALLKQNKNLLPKNTRVRCWCTCPAWQMWGSAANSTSLKYNLTGFFENRAPVIRDPNENKLVCKHVYAVYKRIENDNFIRLYNKFKQAYNRKQKKKSSEAEKLLLLYIYDYLIDMGNDHNETISIMQNLINTDTIEEYLKDQKLII